jgi:DNA-binding NtrC family response regulator
MLIRGLLALRPELRRRIQRLIPEHEAVLVAIASSDLRREIATGNYDLAIVERELLGHEPSRFLRAAAEPHERPETVVLAQRENPADRAALLAAGCLAVLNTELDDVAVAEALLALIARLRQGLLDRLRAERADARGSLRDFASDSAEMQYFLAVARRVVTTDTSLLILGETGTGKERLARAMHDEGPRASGPFVPVNCGALPEALLESELFGHERGAFTGAHTAHRGFFELAHRGTLFLDEIGEMPLPLQVKLLRVLDDRRIRPLGCERTIPVDVRVIAATNRDLAAEVRAGRFRADLFYRLSVVSLTIPPLRARRADVPVLVRNHLESLAKRLCRRPLRVTDAAMRMLAEYPWPGNVRELINSLERAVLLCEGDELTDAVLPDEIAGRRDPTGQAPRLPVDTARPIGEVLAEVRTAVEREYFTALLEKTRGRVGECARLAGVSERTLFATMRRLGLLKETFRQPPLATSPR